MVIGPLLSGWVGGGGEGGREGKSFSQGKDSVRVKGKKKPWDAFLRAGPVATDVRFAFPPCLPPGRRDGQGAALPELPPDRDGRDGLLPGQVPSVRAGAAWQEATGRRETAAAATAAAEDAAEKRRRDGAARRHDDDGNAAAANDPRRDGRHAAAAAAIDGPTADEGSPLRGFELLKEAQEDSQQKSEEEFRFIPVSKKSLLLCGQLRA